MDVLSIIILVFFVLCFGFGVFQGFAKSLISLIRGVVCSLVSLSLCKPFGKFLFGTALGGKVSNFFADKLIEFNPIFSQAVTVATAEEDLTAFLGQLNIPELLAKPLVGVAIQFIEITDGTVAFCLANAFSLYVFIFAAYFILFIGIQIIAFILSHLLKNLFENIPGLAKFDRLIGGVFTLLIGFIIICTINYIFSIIIPLGGTIGTWLSNIMQLQNDEVMTMSKWLYNNNILAKLISWIFGSVKI